MQRGDALGVEAQDQQVIGVLRSAEPVAIELVEVTRRAFFMFRRDSQNGLSLAIAAARAVDIRPLTLPAGGRSG